VFINYTVTVTAQSLKQGCYSYCFDAGSLQEVAQVEKNQYKNFVNYETAAQKITLAKACNR